MLDALRQLAVHTDAGGQRAGVERRTGLAVRRLRRQVTVMALRMTHSIQAVEIVLGGRQIPLADLVVHLVDVVVALLEFGGRLLAAALCAGHVVKAVHMIVRLLAQVNGVAVYGGRRVRVGDRRLP